MALETAAPRTRRAILAGAFGGLAAWAASALGRPEAARAGSDGDVVLGATNTETATTKIQNTANANAVLNVVNTSTGPALVADSTGNDGVRGATAVANRSGVYGVSTVQMGFGVFGRNGPNTGALGHFQAGVYGEGGYGVWGHSQFGFGVTGSSESDCGVDGSSYSSTSPGVYGVNIGGSTGVQGYSGPTTMPRPAAPAKTGVHGYAAQDATAVGVSGQSPNGTGVLASTTTGTALRVAGKAKFSRSGRASVPKGKTNADITVPGGLAANSVVHATLQTYRAGVAIAAVRTNYPSAGKARIYLTKVASASASTSVGWFVTEY